MKNVLNILNEDISASLIHISDVIFESVTLNNVNRFSRSNKVPENRESCSGESCVKWLRLIK